MNGRTFVHPCELHAKGGEETAKGERPSLQVACRNWLQDAPHPSRSRKFRALVQLRALGGSCARVSRAIGMSRCNRSKEGLRVPGVRGARKKSAGGTKLA